MNLLWGYLAIGFAVTLIFAYFFTKIIILKKMPNVIFQLNLGLLFLISVLIWPIFLVFLITIAYANIFGEQLSTESETKNDK